MIGNDVIIFFWLPLVVVVAFVQLRRNATFGHTLAALFLATYLCLLVGTTLFPIPIQSNLLVDLRKEQQSKAEFMHNNFIPLKTVRGVLSSPLASDKERQLGGNLLLLMPLTALLPALWPRFRRFRSALIVAAIVALGIELIQLAASTAYGFVWKIFDVDDIWINTLGAATGYGIYAVIAGIRRIVIAHRNQTINNQGAEECKLPVVESPWT